MDGEQRGPVLPTDLAECRAEVPSRLPRPTATDQGASTFSPVPDLWSVIHVGPRRGKGGGDEVFWPGPFWFPATVRLISEAKNLIFMCWSRPEPGPPYRSRGREAGVESAKGSVGPRGTDAGSAEGNTKQLRCRVDAADHHLTDIWGRCAPPCALAGSRTSCRAWSSRTRLFRRCIFKEGVRGGRRAANRDVGGGISGEPTERGAWCEYVRTSSRSTRSGVVLRRRPSALAGGSVSQTVLGGRSRARRRARRPTGVRGDKGRGREERGEPPRACGRVTASPRSS